MATRKILAIIIALALVLGVTVSLSACSKTKEFEATDNEIGGLVGIGHQSYFVEGCTIHQFTFYDPDTLVMYVYVYDGDGASLSVLYNADGTPKLYNPEK